MINVKIDASAKTMDAIRDAVLEALRLIEEGNITGHNRNSEGNFTFEVTDPE